MLVGIQEEILRLNSLQLLGKLLQDKTTKGNIIWATDAYQEYGPEYAKDREIKVHLIIGRNSNIIKNRVRRELEQQFERTKRHAEVATPLWVCNHMINYIEAYWYGTDLSMINFDEAPQVGLKKEEAEQYIDSRRLEITCGEAPFLVQRYDSCTGEIIPLEERKGLLDLKLRLVKEIAKNPYDWMFLCVRAYQSIYGYEYQGDSLLIARLNMIMSFEDYLWDAWHRKPTKKEYETIIKIITWNLVQMDGLTYQIPCCKVVEFEYEPDLFGEAVASQMSKDTMYPFVKTYNWRRDNSIEMRCVNEGGPRNMKFDFIIGNPPYQDETLGDNKTFAPPIYHLFMDEAYKLGTCVELIHPARFLFNAGSTPKSWNKKMLEDEHFAVLDYEIISSKFFPTTDIKGGIAISYRDAKRVIGPIGTFSAFPELRSIIKKVVNEKFQTLEDIVFPRVSYRLSKQMHEDYPDAIKYLSKGHAYDMSTNILELLPFIFHENKPNDGYDYIQIYGRYKGERKYYWVRREYIVNSTNLDSYKVILPAANGSGALGEVLSTPLIGTPLIGTTETFITIGKFTTLLEAEAALKYIQSKFTRTMLGTLKITQHNNPSTWKNVPLQDFTENSDIDWSKSVADIDKQLYAKYNLSPEEIEFIETHVKEMN